MTRRFGIFWMGYDQLAPAFNLDGAFNDIALTLARGASQPEVIQRLDDLIEALRIRGGGAARGTRLAPPTFGRRSGNCAAWG